MKKDSLGRVGTLVTGLTGSSRPTPTPAGLSPRGVEPRRRSNVRYRPMDGRDRGQRAPSPKTRRGAVEPAAQMRAFVAAIAVGTVRAIRHGFLRGQTSKKGNLTRYTPYLAR